LDIALNDNETRDPYSKYTMLLQAKKGLGICIQALQIFTHTHTDVEEAIKKEKKFDDFNSRNLTS
jgi:hypothetical protein